VGHDFFDRLLEGRDVHLAAEARGLKIGLQIVADKDAGVDELVLRSRFMTT
jgi:hypothetical protein